MKVILTENISNLGHIGKVVSVADGYARNYLLPKRLALKATGKNVKQLEHEKMMLEQKREKVRKELLSTAEKLNEIRIHFQRKVVEEDKLYGSVSITDIQKALAEKGFELDRRTIHLAQPIKQLGEYEVKIKMDPDIESTVKIVVERDE